MAQPRIDEVDYHVLQAKLKAAFAAGGRIEKTDKVRWDEYVKTQGVNVTTMQAVAKVTSIRGKTTLAAVSRDLPDYPEAAKSVVNYGIPDLAGVTASSIDPIALARSVRQAVVVFEPRLNRTSLQVRAVVAGEQMAHNALVF